MKNYDVVVIGGSAAGVTAAVTVRRQCPEKTILLIRKEKHVPIPCGIPYVFGTVGDPQKNLIPVDNMLQNSKVDSIVGEVLDIQREAKVIDTAEGEKIGYDKLIIATGSIPLIPPLPGADKGNVFAIKKDVAYLQGILDKLGEAKDLCIVGCGFIGVEIAEECRKKRQDINISIVEMQRHCLQLVYDVEFCELAEKVLKEQNINLMLDEKVKSLEGKDKVESIKLESGQEIKANMVIMGIGAFANIELAKKIGLEIGPMKGIQVNRYMQTSDKNIFACGDCAEKISFFDGKPSGLKLASIATMEARIAGANLFSIRRVNMGVIGVYSTALQNNAFASAGLTESQALEKGYNIIAGTAEAINRHLGSMPGGANLKVKLVFEAGSRIILGGQVSGALSGGELINTISAFINQRMTADDIATFQTGTHPALTASPIAYQLVNAAENAVQQMISGHTC
ncbi:FAD-dependent oxidoreductase [Acetivibrio cellulolyticus]|uniref:FAD-dependent oxidoreductase n=1 Tax=Acetivibrio cellulolyticus TaxID=35830 RepID=UPI0001E2CC98|nr:FAD-dependent oxidoreductase [Acetivibrio cellulolyticus]